MRVGGAQPKHITIRNEEMCQNQNNYKPVALSKWAGWAGQHALEIQNKITERLAGGMIANSSRKVYAGLFQKWCIHRWKLGHSEFLPDGQEFKEANETAVIAYVTLNLGPIERDAGTVQNHLQAIGYFHKIRSGINPLTTMYRVQNIMKGARREKGPTERKLPVTAEDLNRIYNKVEWGNPDSVTLWCSLSLAWFFMLRMGEYLEKRPTEELNEDIDTRHPLQMDEIEPYPAEEGLNGLRMLTKLPYIYLDPKQIGSIREWSDLTTNFRWKHRNRTCAL